MEKNTLTIFVCDTVRTGREPVVSPYFVHNTKPLVVRSGESQVLRALFANVNNYGNPPNKAGRCVLRQTATAGRNAS